MTHRPTPLMQTLFANVVTKLPRVYQIALRWTGYIPLDVVLEMPWRIDGDANALMSFSRDNLFTDNPFHEGYIVTSSDISLWPFCIISVPEILIAETINLTTEAWQHVPEYVCYLPINEEWQKALLVVDQGSPYGLRPISASDVHQEVYNALRFLT